MSLTSSNVFKMTASSSVHVLTDGGVNDNRNILWIRWTKLQYRLWYFHIYFKCRVSRIYMQELNILFQFMHLRKIKSYSVSASLPWHWYRCFKNYLKRNICVRLTCSIPAVIALDSGPASSGWLAPSAAGTVSSTETTRHGDGSTADSGSGPALCHNQSSQWWPCT